MQSRADACGSNAKEPVDAQKQEALNRSHKNDVLSNATEEASETMLKEAKGAAKYKVKKIEAVIRVKLFWDQNHWRAL